MLAIEMQQAPVVFLPPGVFLFRADSQGLRQPARELARLSGFENQHLIEEG